MRNDERGAGQQNITQAAERFIQTEMVPTGGIDFLPLIIWGNVFCSFVNKMIKTEGKWHRSLTRRDHSLKMHFGVICFNISIVLSPEPNKQI